MIVRTEGELADNTANVRPSLDEALEAGREGVPAVEAVLEHSSDRLRGNSSGRSTGARGIANTHIDDEQVVGFREIRTFR